MNFYIQSILIYDKSLNLNSFNQNKYKYAVFKLQLINCKADKISIYVKYKIILL
ncbi:hypothetical protein SDC9_68780 [bioreactor metagenome]|uniref:Uncharacterized protein n=1 Tax=bioreactor metagenome TaxID=1076179 RepID=A0A644Y2T6_9ZZZZ